MIRVNLLPPELRPAQGTPIGHFLAILAAILVALGAAGYWAWMHFIQLPGARDLRAARQSELVAKEPLMKRAKDLVAELKVYRDRRVAIRTINRSRVLWSQKLDQFFEILTSDQAGYQAWLETLDVPNQSMTGGGSRGRAGPTADGGKLRFSARLAMRNGNDALAQNSLLFKKITGETPQTPSEFFQDFLSITNPAADVVDRGDRAGNEVRLDPPVVAATKYELVLKPRELDGPVPPPVPAAGPPAPGGAQTK